MNRSQREIHSERTNYGSDVPHNHGIINNYFRNQITHYEVPTTACHELSEDRARKCHRLLKTTDYEAHKNFNRQRHPGTCDWVKHHPEFCHWQRSNRSSLLWLSADPGCGKSVLSRFLVDSDCFAQDQATVCYFFFGDNIEQNNLAAALCAVLHQLCNQQPHLVRHVVDSWDQNGDYIQREPATLWRILCAATNDLMFRPMIIILDAIDECVERDRHHLLDLLHLFYSQSSATQSPQWKLKLFATSRLDDGVERFFRLHLSTGVYFRLHGQEADTRIYNDIMLVVKDRARELATEFSLSDKSHGRLVQDLQRIEHRTFLGLDLVLEQAHASFQNSFRPDDVRIDQLPLGVEEIYEQILGNITGVRGTGARSVLLIMLGVKQPLTTRAMSEALTLLSPGSSVSETHVQKQIGKWCGDLVVVSNSRVHLIHKTVKDFLICPDEIAGYEKQAMTPKSWRHSMSMVEIHRKLAVICQKARAASKSALPQVLQANDKPEEDDLVYYASNHGSYHVSEALRYASYHRRVFFVNELSSLGMDVQSLDWNGKSLLHYVVHCYHRTIDYGAVAFLLNRGGLVRNTDKDQFNCLQYAALRNDECLLLILLKAGFQVDWRGDFQNSPNKLKPFNEEILEPYPPVSSLTALQTAACFGQVASVSILLQNQATVGVVDQYGRTALHIAVLGQCSPMFAASHGRLTHCDPGDRYSDNFARRQHAARFPTEASFNRAEIVKMLCKTSPGLVHVKDDRGRTPLHGIACSKASLAKSNGMTLLEHGADPRARDDEGITPIHLAAFYGATDCLELLMTKDDDSSIADNYGRTVLHFAAMGGYEHSAELNFCRSASIAELEAAGGSGDGVLEDPFGPLLCRSGSRAKETLGFLLKSGVQASRTDHYGQDALALYVTNSSCSRRSELVMMLLDHGANVTFKDAEGRNLVHLFLLSSDESKARLTPLVHLQIKGVCLLDLDHKGRSVLHHLAMSKFVYFELVYHLRSCIGVDFGLRDADGKTADDYAHEHRRRGRDQSEVPLEKWDEVMAQFRTIPCIKPPCVCRQMQADAEKSE